MGGYIGATAVGLVTTAADVQGDITSTDTTPELILKNTTETDADGGRDGKITFKGEQSGGEESTLAQIESAHDGTSDDQKGDLIFKTNDGSDGASPTEAMRIESDQQVLITTSADAKGLTIKNSGNNRPYLNMDANRSGAGNNLAQMNFKWDGTDVARIIAVAGADTTNKDDAHITFGTASAGSVNEAMRIDSSGNVGIGTAAPVRNFHLHEAASSTPVVFAMSTNGTGATTGDGFNISLDGSSGAVNLIQRENAAMQFYTNGGTNERMRIDSSGNLLVGKTASDGGVAGHEMRPTSFAAHTISGVTALVARRLTNDGTVILIQYSGGDAGYIGTSNSGDLYIGNSGTGVLFAGGSNGILPINPSNTVLRDNAIDLGSGSYRFDDIFATNGSIQTSDENEKQNIASLTSAEITAATAISKLFKTFKWKDKVSAKGDDARTHTGVIAQQVQTAMSDAGLDASKYAFWCSNTWWEKDVEVAAVEADEEKLIKAQDAFTRTDTYDTKEEAPEGATERTRMGVRYPELLAFIGAATEQRLTSIESRLTALEAE